MQAASEASPALGVLIFMLGGAAGAVFYLPFRKIKHWAWENYWLIYAIFGLIVVPWIFTLTTSPNVISVLRAAPGNQVAYCLLCGAVWGVGGLTWGLMIRYLGVGLGLALGAGITSAAGTLIPPMLKGKQAIAAMFTTASGVVSLSAAVVSVAGIVFVGLAGKRKQDELPAALTKKAVEEFNFRKGLTVAIFSGLMSSAMSFGLQGGPQIQELALATAPATSVVWAGMPVLVTVLLGGFIVNALWCVVLNFRNHSAGDYLRPEAPVALNLFLAALAGGIWCLQFVSFKTGEPQMGHISYIGWAVLMASQILFSQVIGVVLGEWKAVGRKTLRLLVTGLSLLIVSALFAAYSGYLGSKQL